MADKTVSLEGLSLPILTGNNYPRWRNKMRILFEARDLDGVVYGSQQGPTDAEIMTAEFESSEDNKQQVIAAKEAVKKFKQVDAQARYLLSMAMDDKHSDMVVDCYTARQIWEKLRIEFADSTATSTQELLTEYFSYKKKRDQSISEYVAKLDQMADRLKNSGHQQQPDSIIVRIVQGLTDDYEAVIRMWDMTPKLYQQRELLIQNLKKEEKRLQEHKPKGIALVAKRNDGGNSSSNPNSNSNNKLARQKRIQQWKKEGVCKHCNQQGHWWKECPSRPKDQVPQQHNHGHDKSQGIRRAKALCVTSMEGDDDATDWYFDSGASNHFCSKLEWFTDYKPFSQFEEIKYGDGIVSKAIGSGTIKVISQVNGETIELDLTDVRYVPNISNNLISWGQASRKGLRLTSYGNHMALDDDEETLVTGKRTGVNLWKLNIKVKQQGAANFCKSNRTLGEWHAAMGHPDIAQIKNMKQKNCASGLEIIEVSQERCGDCQLGKGHRASHPPSQRSRAQEVLERVHVDLVGPITPVSKGGAEYFMLLKDEYSSYMFVYFLSSKRHLFHKIQAFIDEETARTHRRVRFIMSDNGSEFDNTGMKLLCAKEGITQEFSAPYVPQQNGLIERANRTVIETTRTLLQSSGLALKFWSEAVNTAVYLRNRMTNSRNGNATPFELYIGRKPDLSHLIPFGEEVYVLDRDRSTKFAPKTIAAYMVGYCSRINTYRCLLRHREEIIESPDVVPAKHRAASQQQPSVVLTQPMTTFLISDENVPRQRTMAPDESFGDETASISTMQATETIDLPDEPTDEQRRRCTDNPLINDSPDKTDRADSIETCSIDSAPSIPEYNYTGQLAEDSDDNSNWRQALRDSIVHQAQQQVAGSRDEKAQRTSHSSSSQPLAPAATSQHTARTTPQSPKQRRVSIDPAPHVRHPGVLPMPSPNETTTQQSSPNRAPASSSSSQQHGGSGASGNCLSPQRVIQRISRAFNPSSRQQAPEQRRIVPPRNVKSVYMRNMMATVVPSGEAIDTHDHCTFDSIFEPKNHREAIESDDCAEWKLAINSELQAHAKNGTWDIVPKPPHAKEISSRWLFKVKYSADGSVDRFKARIVARGFSQVEGRDYGEIFAPVVRMDSVRLLFSICAQQNLEFAQFDVTTAFLHGELEEELYLSPPDGLTVPRGHTCLLRKSLYGLRQAPRCWNTKLVKMLEQFDMQQTASDPCVFVGHYPDLVYLGFYVDDGILFARNRQTIDRVLGYLKKHFEIKEIDSKCFIGFEIVQNKQDSSIFLHQRGYIKRVLERFGMINSKATATPLEAGHTLNKPEILQQEPITDVPYAEALGNLLYCAVLTRPDLAFALSVLSKFTKCPREQHWIGLKRVMRYLRGTMDVGLLYKPIDNPRIICYTDADYAGDHENRRSTSGVVTFINTGPVTFKAKQQACVSLSTTESEYIAATVGAKDIIWLQRFIAELDHPIPAGASLMCDNQGAIKLIKNPEFHERTKHIEVRYHFIREKWATGMFDLHYVETDKQRADVLTKALSSEKHNTLMRMLGCYSLNSLDYEAKN